MREIRNAQRNPEAAQCVFAQAELYLYIKS